MDPRTNGHGEDAGVPPEPERPRRPVNGRAGPRSPAQSARAADQLARLETRIQAFHHNLESLGGAEADIDGLSRSTAEAHEAADSLVSRAAAAARVAAGADEAMQNGAGSAPASGERRRRSDRRADGPFTAQRRIDALRPEARFLTEDPSRLPPIPRAPDAIAEARATAERIRHDAEREAAEIRQGADAEMQYLWQALEAEIETIQHEISRRVDHLAGRMEAVGQETEQIRRAGTEEAQAIRAVALAETAQIRAAAASDVDGLLAVAEREAHALLNEARDQADALIAVARARAAAISTAPDPIRAPPAAASSAPRASERTAADRLADQIREATAAFTRRVSRAGEAALPVHPVAREIRNPGAIPGSIREVVEGLGAAVALIERSLTGLSELLADPHGSDDGEAR